MKKYIHHIFIALMAISLTCCSKNDEPLPTPDPDLQHTYKRTILVYAVAANNLSSNLDLDLKEMLTGMQDIDLDQYQLMVCKVQLDPTTSSATPQELVKITDASFGRTWQTVKTYSSDLRSVDPKRISEVLADVSELSPSENYGLVFWSHSDAWNPSANYTVPQERCFGQERDGNKYYYCETPDLAYAIPDGWAEFIWFDSCYMANIETAYEFRNKCQWFVGSAIELDAYGMPYDQTLPILLSEKGSIVDAARTTFNYFGLRPCPGTMSVYDMSHIEDVAQAAEHVMTDYTPLASTLGLQKYSRSITPALYDFAQFISMVADQNGTDATGFTDAMKKFVVYKEATPYGWGGMPLDVDLHSGVSCSVYTDSDSKGDTFYRTLAWYNRVFTPNQD